METTLIPLFVALFWIFSGLTAYIMLGQTFHVCAFPWSPSNQSIAALISIAGPAALMAAVMTVVAMPLVPVQELSCA